MKKLKFLAILICFFTISLSSCSWDNRHVQQSEQENNNSDIHAWDDISDPTIIDWSNVEMQSWDESQTIRYYVNCSTLMDDLCVDFPLVECEILDYKSNGKYFEGEKVFELVGNKFDLNGLLTKFAIGTGVILVSVVLTVATYGSGTPFACFIAGAATGAIKASVKGAVLAGAISSVTSAIKNKGQGWDQILYDTLEGTSEGYMWGAIFGAITGGLTSEYCFTGDTKVKTQFGYDKISNIQPGDKVWSYNEELQINELKEVTTIHKNITDTLAVLSIGSTSICSTPSHLFRTSEGYFPASDIDEDDLLKSFNEYKAINSKATIYQNPTEVYNLTIADNHNYYVSEEDVLVHNTCKNQKWADKTYKYENSYDDYLRTGDQKYLDKYNSLLSKYPDGVKFTSLDKNGITSPIFDPYVPKEKGILLQHTFPKVTEENLKKGICLIGDSTTQSLDFAKMKSWLGTQGFSKAEISDIFSRYTPHHAPDMRTIQMIPKDLHEGVRHTGGAALIRSEFEGLLKLLGFWRG